MTKRHATPNGDCELAELVESTAGRLHEAIAILRTIEDADLLAELPAQAEAKAKHQAAVSLLAVLRRELMCVANEMEAAVQTNDVLSRAMQAARLK